jgi:hypothetical protein
MREAAFVTHQRISKRDRSVFRRRVPPWAAPPIHW